MRTGSTWPNGISNFGSIDAAPRSCTHSTENECGLNHAANRHLGGFMVTRTDIGPTTTMGGAPIIGADQTRSDGPGPEVMSAETLIGDSVVNSAGEDLGDIKAIMLDVTTGRIAYAVLSFGGFLGVGNKLFAIPWTALTLDAAEKRFILNIAKDRLENAPGFDKDHWPSMADSSWANEIHAYYDVRPYWDDNLSSARDTRTSAGSESSKVF
jgi:sporulation protein YlmC with PRC-barrel domain